MKTLLVIVVCFVQVALNAQDTIYKRSGDVIPARVIEINTKEISYRRESMADGPLYILDKNEVKKIKYKTGAVDSFNVYTDVKATPGERQSTGLVVTYNEQMKKHPRKGLYIYQGRTISDTRAMFIATNKNITWKNSQLESEILNANKNKNRQLISGFGGPALGILIITSTVVAFNNASADATVPLVLCGNAISVIIASQIVCVHFKIKRVKHSDTAVALYNQNL